MTSAGYLPETVQNLEISTLFDGLFHATTWITVAIALVFVHRAIRGGGVWDIGLLTRAAKTNGTAGAVGW